MEMTRTFHPVGQGGFFTEVFSVKNSEERFTVAYDVGSNTADKKYLQEAIGLVGKVDVVFLSHLHEDHINGLSLLLEKKPNLKIIMPVLSIEEQLETALYNLILSKGTFIVYDKNTLCQAIGIKQEFVFTIAKSDNESDNKDIHTTDIDGSENNRVRISYEEVWQYIPYNPNTKSKDLVNAFTKSNDDGIRSILNYQNEEPYEINIDALKNAFKNSKVLKETYESVYGKNHNSYSMSVYSGPKKKYIHKWAKIQGDISARIFSQYCKWAEFTDCFFQKYNENIPHCLYTGDAELQKNNSCKLLIKYYSVYWDFIGIIQVPHHGSSNNYNTLLHKASDYEFPIIRLFVISVGSNNSYGHPSVSVINEIYENDGCLSIITESSVPLSFKYEF